MNEYFSSKDSLGRPRYGVGFDLFARGDDHPDDQNRITAEDLVATSFLSVDIPGWVAQDLLEGVLGHEVAAQLRDIPPTVQIGSQDAPDLLKGPAQRAWDALRARGTGGRDSRGYGIGSVTRAKLLARKRPHLIPVSDSVIRGALGKPTNLWNYHQALFLDHGDELRRLLDQARTDAGVDGRVSHLRLLDVIVWMRHSRKAG
ncbi:MAG: hypothetical protein H0T66_09215 [Geodermatophilaceae bacterium]|nr:hypothetical protein [Geodermatophilaceae bacterium]